MTAATSYNNHSLVGNALHMLAVGLGPYVKRKMEAAIFEGRYVPDDAEVLGEISGDVAVILRVMTTAWNDVFRDFLGQSERSLVSEIREIRNRWAHQESFNDDDLDRALDSIGRLLAAVAATNEAGRVNRAKHRLRRKRYGQPEPPANTPEPAPEDTALPEPAPVEPEAAAPPDDPPASDSDYDDGDDEEAARKAASAEYVRRGVAYRSQEAFDRALEEFEQAIAICPDNAAAWRHRGMAWGLMGDHERAFADFTRAIELSPEYAEAYNCRGYARLCLGEYRQAVEDLERANRLNPDDELTRSNLQEARIRWLQQPGSDETTRRSTDAGSRRSS